MFFFFGFAYWKCFFGIFIYLCPLTCSWGNGHWSLRQHRSWSQKGKGNEFIMFLFIYFHGELCLQTNLLFKTPTFVWWHIITTFTVTLSERDPIFTWCHGCFLLFGMIYASLGSQMAKWSAFTRLGGRTFPGTELYLPEPCLAGLPMPSSWEIAVSICWGCCCEEPD